MGSEHSCPGLAGETGAAESREGTEDLSRSSNRFAYQGCELMGYPHGLATSQLVSCAHSEALSQAFEPPSLAMYATKE